MSEKWETSISSSGKDSVVRDVPREDVMDMGFADAIFLLLRGKEPSDAESKLFNTVLSSSIDHGVGNPSSVSARTVQSGGNDMNTSVAAGVLALGDKHGGAIEDCMAVLQQEDFSAEDVVESFLDSGDKIPGLGHKVYDEADPRAQKIFDRAEELGLAGKHTDRVKEIADTFAEKKVRLPINVDGAIAGVMSDLGWEKELGKGIFIISRTPGLVAHVREEMDEPDFRRQEGEYRGES